MLTVYIVSLERQTSYQAISSTIFAIRVKNLPLLQLLLTLDTMSLWLHIPNPMLITFKSLISQTAMLAPSTAITLTTTPASSLVQVRLLTRNSLVSLASTTTQPPLNA